MQVSVNASFLSFIMYALWNQTFSHITNRAKAVLIFASSCIDYFRYITLFYMTYKWNFCSCFKNVYYVCAISVEWLSLDTSKTNYYFTVWLYVSYIIYYSRCSRFPHLPPWTPWGPRRRGCGEAPGPSCSCRRGRWARCGSPCSTSRAARTPAGCGSESSVGSKHAHDYLMPNGL